MADYVAPSFVSPLKTCISSALNLTMSQKEKEEFIDGFWKMLTDEEKDEINKAYSLYKDMYNGWNTGNENRRYAETNWGPALDRSLQSLNESYASLMGSIRRIAEENHKIAIQQDEEVEPHSFGGR